MTGTRGKGRRDPSSHIGFLDEVEGRRRSKTSKKDRDDELDLDRAWTD